jgi:RHS repeat-associated protein
MLSPFVPRSADECIRAFESQDKKPHHGVAPQNPALHQGIAWSNSTSALGLQSLAVENRVGSRCTGKERDSESGLDYFGARHYSPSVGRFMVPDPAGVWVADLAAPQSWNLYSYALNNPLKYTDPTGLYCYYGNTSEGTSDWGDQSQYDFHSSTGECADNGGQWFDDPSTTVIVNGNTGDVDTTKVDVGNNELTPTSITQTFHDRGSFYGCVRSGMDAFSLQSGVQYASGGKLGNGWLAGAFLGNSVQSVGDTIQLLARGRPGVAPAVSVGVGKPLQTRLEVSRLRPRRKFPTLRSRLVPKLQRHLKLPEFRQPRPSGSKLARTFRSAQWLRAKPILLAKLSVSSEWLSCLTTSAPPVSQGSCAQ